MEVSPWEQRIKQWIDWNGDTSLPNLSNKLSFRVPYMSTESPYTASERRHLAAPDERPLVKVVIGASSQYLCVLCSRADGQPRADTAAVGLKPRMRRQEVFGDDYFEIHFVVWLGVFVNCDGPYKFFVL